MHQAIRVGEHFGQTDDFKLDGFLTKQSRILYGKSYRWGHNWARKKILFHCDNNTLVSSYLEQGVHTLQGNHDSGVHVTLLCCTLCYDNTHHWHVRIANAVSHFQMDCFRSQAPHTDSHADTILALLTPSSAMATYKIAAILGIAPSTRCVASKPFANFVSSLKFGLYQLNFTIFLCGHLCPCTL